MRKRRRLRLKVDDSYSIGDIADRATNLLRKYGLNSQAREMKTRLNEVQSAEEILKIIDDYVVIV